MSEVLTNPRIVFVETMYGFTGEFVMSANRDLTEKDFKKWYDHTIKSIPKKADVDVYAIYDTEDGWADITSNWFIHEMNMKMDAVNGIPEELPFN